MPSRCIYPFSALIHAFLVLVSDFISPFCRLSPGLLMTGLLCSFNFFVTRLSLEMSSH